VVIFLKQPLPFKTQWLIVEILKEIGEILGALL